MEEGIAVEPVDHIDLTVDIVTAYVSNNHVQAADLPALIGGVHAALGGLGKEVQVSEPAPEKPTSSQIKRSVTPDALISFVDGKPYKTLKRHLTKHGLDLAAYRERYGLPSDYPSTAPNYSAARSQLAKGLGLGRKGVVSAEAPPAPESAPAAAAPKRRGRKKADAGAV